MARKINRCRKNSPSLKQKKILISRLMQISMKIDDYLYKQKTVSVTEAQQYIQEMESYKSQCIGDIRSQQVIEKINRCMNAIIMEQQGSTSSTFGTQTYCPSPVYSLPDEDRLLFSQEPINSSTKEIETIDLCDENDGAIREEILVDVQIHRAMSGLSITDETPVEDYEFSQSILSNIDTEINLCNFNKVDNILINKMASGNVLKPTNIPFEGQPIQDNKTNNNSNIIKTTKNVQSKMDTQNIKPKDNVIFKKPKSMDLADNKAKNKGQGKNLKKGTGSKNKSHSKDTKGNAKAKDQRKIISTNGQCNKVNNKSPKTINKTVTITTEAVTNGTVSNTAQQVVQAHININNNNHILTNPCERDDKSFKIYNGSVENDLSWVENIRYVREIASEEHDNRLATLDDTFWNSIDFPGNRSDKDFDYFM